MTDERVDCDALAAVYGDGADAYDAIWSPVIRPSAVSVIEALGLDGSAAPGCRRRHWGALRRAHRRGAPRVHRVRRRVITDAAIRPRAPTRRGCGRGRDAVALCVRQRRRSPPRVRAVPPPRSRRRSLRGGASASPIRPRRNRHVGERDAASGCLGVGSSARGTRRPGPPGARQRQRTRNRRSDRVTSRSCGPARGTHMARDHRARIRSGALLANAHRLGPQPVTSRGTCSRVTRPRTHRDSTAARTTRARDYTFRGEVVCAVGEK